MKNRKLYLGLVLMCSLHAGAQSLYPGVAEDKIVKNIDDKVQLLSFDLSEVRLHEGVLYNAMQANRKWLLDLSPDRFLCRFYEYAGLPAKAPIYGGWESQEFQVILWDIIFRLVPCNMRLPGMRSSSREWIIW